MLIIGGLEKMKKKFNWIGFIALIVWDLGFIQFLMFAMAMSNSLLSMLPDSSNLQIGFSAYYIILLIILILGDLIICRDNKWMICLGVANLIWYGVSYHFNVSPLSIVGCILVVIAGIYGIMAENKLRVSQKDNGNNTTN